MRTRDLWAWSVVAPLLWLCLVALALPAAAQERAAGSIEQRVAVCIACHGRTGAATAGGYFPRLAGKPAGYLFNQLRNFRDGRRFSGDMVYLVRHLSDDYLREMAEYFAALDLPYPTPPAVTDVNAEMLARGRRLALEGDAARSIPACVQCHGAALTGVEPAIPGLVGLPRLYLSSQLGAWLSRDRSALAPDCMAQIGQRMTSADINAVAGWIAQQPVPAGAAKAIASLPDPLPMPCGGTGSHR